MATPLPLLRRTAATLLASLLLLAALIVPAHAESRVLYVEPQGDDGSPGTLEEPFGTLDHALSQLRAGDTLYVRGGTYRERIDRTMPGGTAEQPTQVVAMPGERPVVEGLLWLRDGSHWVLDGLEVTWDAATGASNEHMVKVANGTDWVVRNVEIHGAESFAGMLIAGTRTGEPANWQLRDSCLHDTVPSNGTNQDHNLYVNSGLSAGSGLIEGNVFFGAPNGENIKMGPPSSSGGTANVVVRHNTLFDAAQNVLISGESRDNLVERNIIGRATGNNYGNVRGYQLTAESNVARDNVGFDAATFILNYKGGSGVTDGGDNRFPLDPGFDRTDTCDGFAPGADAMDGYGHLAAAPSDDSPPPPEEDDGSTDDGSTDDGSTDDGSTDDGSTDDGSTDDGSTDDGSTDDGSTDDGSTDDGSTDDGSTDDGTLDDGTLDDESTDDGSTDEKDRPAKKDKDDNRKTPPGRFKDVDGSSVHASAITELDTAGIIQGVDEHHFAPRRSVTRAQLATMMVRLRTDLDAPLPVPTSSPFEDVGGLPHGPNVAALADRGIVLGRTATTFAPGASLTRAQLASILVRAYEDVGGELPAAERTAFLDARGSVHETAIARAEALGLVQGVDARHYRPGAPVSRDQLASTLFRFREAVLAR